jgi:hypothetical protein
MVERAHGVEYLEDLQQHENHEISDKANQLLLAFYTEESPAVSPHFVHASVVHAVPPLNLDAFERVVPME